MLLLPVFLTIFCTIAHQTHEISLNEYGEHQRLIGSGGTASVHLYQRQNDSFKYAVKSFLSKWDNNRREEFEIAISLQHDSIVDTYDLVHVKEKWFQVMEYCPRRLWNAVYSENSTTISSATCNFRQLVDGVTYMHNQGVAHQDLKLSNIMLDTNGNIKVIDFGIAYRFRGLFKKTISRRYGMVPHLYFDVS